jgi:hypothetical protein
MAVFIGAVKGSSNRLTATSRKNQANLNKAIYWGMRYNELNDMRDRASDMGDERAYRKLDRQCEVAFDKHLDFMGELPKKEQARVEKLVFG